MIYLKKESTDKQTRTPTREIVGLIKFEKVEKMKYKISKMLSVTLALPLMLGLNLSPSFAVSGEEKINVGKQAINDNSELSLTVAFDLVKAADNWLKLDGQFPRALSLDELRIESLKQERFLMGDGGGYQSQECRRSGICES